eukprot:306265-Chlamydomonas_euryale.AAC.1
MANTSAAHMACHAPACTCGAGGRNNHRWPLDRCASGLSKRPYGSLRYRSRNAANLTTQKTRPTVKNKKKAR